MTEPWFWRRGNLPLKVRCLAGRAPPAEAFSSPEELLGVAEAGRRALLAPAAGLGLEAARYGAPGTLVKTSGASLAAETFGVRSKGGLWVPCRARWALEGRGPPVLDALRAAAGEGAALRGSGRGGGPGSCVEELTASLEAPAVAPSRFLGETAAAPSVPLGLASGAAASSSFPGSLFSASSQLLEEAAGGGGARLVRILKKDLMRFRYGLR